MSLRGSYWVLSADLGLPLPGIFLPSLNCCFFSTNVAAMLIAQYSVMEDLGQGRTSLGEELPMLLSGAI